MILAELVKKVLENKITFKNDVVDAEIEFGSNVLNVNGKTEYLHTIIWNNDLPQEVYDILMKYNVSKQVTHKKK